MFGFPDIADEAKPFSGHRLDQMLFLAAVADRFAHRVDMAGQGRFRDDPPAPHRVQQAVLADDMLAVLHQVKQQVEDLRTDRDGLRPSRQLPPLRVEHAVFENELHVSAP